MDLHEIHQDGTRPDGGPLDSRQRDAAPSRRRRKSAAVTIAITGLLASAVMTGCAPGGDVIDADYAKVCQDRTTQQRVEDSKCSEEGRSSSVAGWYFIPMGSLGQNTTRNIPAVGQGLSGGQLSIPSASTAKTGVSSKGSSVSRGGFGGSSKGGSMGG